MPATAPLLALLLVLLASLCGPKNASAPEIPPPETRAAGRDLGPSFLASGDLSAEARNDAGPPASAAATRVGPVSLAGYRFESFGKNDGLFAMQARHSRAGSARFLSLDPSGFPDGANRYRIVVGNPGRFADQSGLNAGAVAGAEFGGALGGVPGAIFAGAIGAIATLVGIDQCLKLKDILRDRTDTDTSDEDGSFDIPGSLFHYTSAAGYFGIWASQAIFPSTGEKNARYGAGVYLTDVPPELIAARTKADVTPEQAAKGMISAFELIRRLYGVPRGHLMEKIEWFLEIDVSGFVVENPREHVFLVRTTTPLSVFRRIIRSGSTF